MNEYFLFSRENKSILNQTEKKNKQITPLRSVENLKID